MEQRDMLGSGAGRGALQQLEASESEETNRAQCLPRACLESQTGRTLEVNGSSLMRRKVGWEHWS